VQGYQEGSTGAQSTEARGAACRLPGASLRLAPHERAVELREVALNVRTCQAILERGVPPKSARQPASAKVATSAGERRGPGAGSGVRAAAFGYQWSGYSRSWYTDRRTGRIVSEIDDGADWNSDGGCIGANNVWFRTAADRSTGWRQVSHRWSVINTACNVVVSSVNAHFRNSRFRGCSGPPPVDTHYTRARFAGRPDGSISGGRRSRNEPGCFGVLIAYYALYRVG
jgi:hypothetical protein